MLPPARVSRIACGPFSVTGGGAGHAVVQTAAVPALVIVTESTYQPVDATLESSPSCQRSLTGCPLRAPRPADTGIQFPAIEKHHARLPPIGLPWAVLTVPLNPLTVNQASGTTVQLEYVGPV